MPAPGITKKIIKKHITLAAEEVAILVDGMLADCKTRLALYNDKPGYFKGVPLAVKEIERLSAKVQKAKSIVLFMEKP